jgi:DNA-binding PadR family transcriptional regulator
MKNNKNINSELLQAWEDTYKKGQLTLWVFLALKEGPKYVPEIKDFIGNHTEQTISCEEQSLYRTLRKFHHLEMIGFSTAPGKKGPERKYYELTELGESILEKFVQRNIRLFFKDKVKTLLNFEDHETNK